jgi:hypothetical protein
MKHVAFLFALALAACGGPQEPAQSASTQPVPTTTTTATATAAATTEAPPPPAPTTTAPPVEEPAPIVFDGLKFAPTAPAKVKSVTLAADGTLQVDGKTVAKIVKNTIQDDTGKTMVTVEKDGSIQGAEAKQRARFNDKDEIEIDGGGIIRVKDNGTAELQNGTKTEAAPVKIEGLTPKNKRAAALVVGYLVLVRGPAKK